MDRRVTPPNRVTSPTWGPPPPCKQALRHLYCCHWCPPCIVMLDIRYAIKLQCSATETRSRDYAQCYSLSKLWSLRSSFAHPYYSLAYSGYSVRVSKPFQGRRCICSNWVLTSGKKAHYHALPADCCCPHLQYSCSEFALQYPLRLVWFVTEF